MQTAEKVGEAPFRAGPRTTLCARVGGGYIYRPMTSAERAPRSQSSPALHRIYGERRCKQRRETERRDFRLEAPELSLVNEECQQLRVQLQDRRREESRLSSRLDQLESSVYDRMHRLHAVLCRSREEHSDAQSRSEISEERLAALQQQLERIMAEGLRSSGSDPEASRCQFRHVLGPERPRDNSSTAWRQNIDALKESERANRRQSSNLPTVPVEGLRQMADLTLEETQLAEDLPKTDALPREDRPIIDGQAGTRKSQVEATSESLAEVRRMAEFWKMKAEAAERRACAMAEAINELALVADERHVEALEKQLLLQQQLASAEQRCEAFLEVWESVLQMAVPVDEHNGSSSPEDGKSVFIFQ
ncbi:unnamed protein product [Cladocopium goreaui]|uniref:Uncharacterized protein n=1 Tax=Cladocopium goreaui TaxID=2562237 RepID=A0A9P1GSP2_9DINO|nr:unnamed protein product [Cladocopium goreaui]